MPILVRMSGDERLLWKQAQWLPADELLMALKEIIWTAPRPTVDEEFLYVVDSSEVPELAWEVMKMARNYGYADKLQLADSELGADALQVDGSLFELLINAVKVFLEFFMGKFTSGNADAIPKSPQVGVEVHGSINRGGYKPSEFDGLCR